LLGGFLSGLLGIGGGPIYIFALTIFISNLYDDYLTGDQQVKMVIANSSFAKLFATLAGSIAYIRRKEFLVKEIALIGLPALVLVFLCSHWLSQIEFSKRNFSIVFVIMILPMLFKLLLDDEPKKNDWSKRVDVNSKILKLLLLGILAGVVPSVSGMGGGFIVVPILIYFLGYNINESISISLGVICCTSFALSLYYGFSYGLPDVIPNTFGAISWGMCLPLVIGVLIAAPIGVKVSNSLKPRTIRLLFVAICLIIIGKTVIVDLM